MSALACILGNLFYCLSYDLKSLPLLLLARLITGVGERSHPCVCQELSLPYHLRLPTYLLTHMIRLHSMPTLP